MSHFRVHLVVRLYSIKSTRHQILVSMVCFGFTWMYGIAVCLLCLGGGGILKRTSCIADGNDLNTNKEKVMKHLSPS